MDRIEDLNTWTIEQLKDELRTLGLAISGNKGTLTKRLAEAYAERGRTSNRLEGEQGRLQDLEDQSEVLAGESASQVSSARGSRASRISSLAERRANIASERAALTRRKNLLKEMEEIEEQQLKLKQRKNRLALEADLAAVEEKERVLDEIVYNGDNEVGPASQLDAGPTTQSEHLDIEVLPVELGVRNGPERNKIVAEKKEDQKKEQLLEILVNQSSRSRLPNQEVTKFDGSLIAYQTFIRAFDSSIASRLEDDDEKLFYLNQYTTGKPKEIVQACLHMKTGGYKEARSILQRRYGNPDRIAAVYIDEVLRWPEIRKDDVEALDEFSILLRSCNNALKDVPYGTSELQNPRNMRAILEKLPIYIQDRWRRKAYEIVEFQSRQVGFGDLVTFVEVESRIQLDPLFGKQLLVSRKRIEPVRNVGGKRNVSVNLVGKNIQCWYCKGNHMLHKCSELIEMDHTDRLEAIKELKLCFNCLGSGHISKWCNRKVICSVCSGRHPDLLHRSGDNQNGSIREVRPNNPNEAGTSSGVQIFTSLGSSRSSSGMSVVPVRVRGMNGREVTTYAFLDSGSGATFCSAELLKKMGVKFDSLSSSSLSISTISGLGKLDTRLVVGLEIKDLDGVNSISLPPIYAIKNIPISQSDVIRKRDLERWPHLKNVYLPEIVSEVGLLIGNNVPHVMEPFEVVHAQGEYEPYAMKTRLGWVICGADIKGKDSVSVNRIKVGNFGEDYDRLLIEAYNKDFIDVGSQKLGLSEEDKSWIKMLDEKTRFAFGSYHVPLPFRSDFETLPYNRNSTLNRLFSLRRKLLKEDLMKREYWKFISEMLAEGYAEAVPEAELGAGLWYIPHFCVTHQSKPGKVRVVFDCAAKCEGTSLNDYLLAGPDLNNLLIQVLLRFREGKYAYSADIRSMFYQVQIPKWQRDYLRFFWWQNENLEGSPVEYRMCVHPFGASSSPGCSMYALKRTVSDNESEFDQGVLDTVMRNFYVDDCLKSVDSLENMMLNAEQVRELCRRGGFELTKFCSSSWQFNEIFMMDEETEVKDISEKSISLIKTLGLKWDLTFDYLSVDLSVNRLPSTKKGLLSRIASIYDPLGMASPLILEGRIIMQDLCRRKMKWDELIKDDLVNRIDQWVNRLNIFGTVVISRSFKPCSAEKIKHCSLHYFSDASEIAYATVAYLRTVDVNNEVFVRFVMAKGRVCPLKAVSIPRLELAAAVLSVRLHHVVLEALDLTIHDLYFWSDSTTVLKYLRSSNTRFHIYVANRVGFIKENTNVSCWHYISSKCNPADDATCCKQVLG